MTQWPNRLKGLSRWWPQTAALSSSLLTLVLLFAHVLVTVGDMRQYLQPIQVHPAPPGGFMSYQETGWELDRPIGGHQSCNRTDIWRERAWKHHSVCHVCSAWTCFHVWGEQGSSNRPVSSAALWLWSQAPLKDVRISHTETCTRGARWRSLCSALPALPLPP